MCKNLQRCCIAEVLNSSPRAPPLCIFCMSLFVNTPDSDNQLVRSALHAWTVFRLTCSLHRVHCSLHRVHCSLHRVHCSLLPEQGNPLKFTSFRNIHSWICAAQRLHARTSVSSYTSVNIYNFNSRLAHFNALWMEYIRSLRTGIMEEYPVMCTSQGTCVRIEETSEAIRVTYEICRAGGRGGWNWEPQRYSDRITFLCFCPPWSFNKYFLKFGLAVIKYAKSKAIIDECKHLFN